MRSTETGVGSVHLRGPCARGANDRCARPRSSSAERVAHPAGPRCWLATVVAARVVVQELVAGGAHLRLPFPPLDASLDWRPGWALLWSVAVGGVAVAWGPRLARACSWRGVLVGSTIMGAAWAVALALLDGTQGLVGSVGLKNEYFLDVRRVGAPISFLHGFVEHLAKYRIHVQGHPPGYLLVLWTLERLGLGSQSAVAALEIGVGVLAIPAVLLAVREVAGDAAARAAAPFVAVAPVAIWVATSADAFYAGVGAWAVALVVLATGRQDGRSVGYALGGGVLFGVTAFLSYGLVLLAIIPIAVAWRRRRIGPLVLAAIGASTVFAAFALAGFWWFDGLAATRRQYLAGVASRRPYLEFLLVDAACFAIALGPAIAVALGTSARSAGLAGRRCGSVGRCWCSVQRHVEGRGRTDLAAVRDMGAAGGRGARARRPSSPVVGGPGGVHHRPPDPGAQPVVILVTGGAGFIGSFVVDQRSWPVTRSGCSTGCTRARINASRTTSTHVRTTCGATSPIPRSSARAVDGVDAVCHQAAMVGLGVDFADARAYVHDNDIGTATLLGALHGRGFRGRLVVASSMVVYGEGAYQCDRHGSVRPRPRTRTALDAHRWEPMCPDCGGRLHPVAVAEEHRLDPRNVYAATKLHQEHLCAAYGREHDSAVVALRYHNVYGPRMPRDTPYAGVASIFRSALAAGRAPSVFEDGGQLRDFVHVSDVARERPRAARRRLPSTAPTTSRPANRTRSWRWPRAIAAARGDEPSHRESCPGTDSATSATSSGPPNAPEPTSGSRPRCRSPPAPGSSPPRSCGAAGRSDSSGCRPAPYSWENGRSRGRGPALEHDLRDASDAALVVAIARFREEALSEAYRRHGDAAFGLAVRVLHDRALAEEIVQEVFLRLWNDPEKFDPGRGSLRAFIMATVHSRAIDVVRAESSRRAREERHDRLRPEPDYDLEREIVDLTVAEQVRAALEGLCDDEREAIELAYFGGHSYREVATLLEQPEGTVKSRIRVGLRRLRDSLVESGITSSWTES